MTKVMQTVYDAYLQALQDGAIAEAQVLSNELDDLAADAQQLSPTDDLIVG